MPGDYPGPDDLDVLVSSKMWTKVGGGALAETGLAPARLIREEERAKGAVSAAAHEGEPGAQAPTSSGSVLSLDSSLVAPTSTLDSVSPPCMECCLGSLIVHRDSLDVGCALQWHPAKWPPLVLRSEWVHRQHHSNP
jgi:hypothetical protein